MRFSPAKLLFLATLCLVPHLSPAAETMTGAGSSAAYPVYKIWAEQFKASGGNDLSYDPVGSSAGLRMVTARLVDFGACDLAPRSEQLARDNLVLFPTLITGVVPVVNLPKIDGGPLVLDGEVLARIFLGDIKQWDAPEIRALNPRLKLPAKAIVPIVRADGSGSTYNFADYLAKVSPAWKQRMGVSAALKWPEGFVGAKGSKGVAEIIQHSSGGIAYIDYNDVLEHKLTPVALKNAEAVVVEANPTNFLNALRQSSWQQNGDFTQPLTNLPGKKSWPITIGTFIVMPRVALHPERSLPVIRFFTWAFTHGDELSNKVNFVRLPNAIQAKSFRAMAEIVDTTGQPIGINGLQ